MSKAIQIARASTKEAFNMFAGLTLSHLISAVGTIIIARLLTPSGYGLFTIAMIPPTLISLFREWGVNSAMIKYLAQYREENQTEEIKNILVAGFLFEAVMGFLLYILSISLSGFMATNVFHRPIKTVMEVASFIIFMESLLVASKSAFIGFERMHYWSLTNICNSILRTFLAPLLVLLGYGIFGAVLGSVMAVAGSGVLGVTILYHHFYKKVQTNNYILLFGRTLKKMLGYGLPLFIAHITTVSLLQFYNFLLAIYCSDYLIGNYQVAVKFTILIIFFTTPIMTVLFPAFSKLGTANTQKEEKTLKTMFQSSVKYSSLLTLPAATIIMVLSSPLIFTLFGEEYASAPLFLTLYAAVYLYTGLGDLSIGSLLSGQGKTSIVMKRNLLTLAVGLPLSIFLIPRFQVLGLIGTLWVAGIPSLAWGLWWIKKHFGATIDWSASARMYLASGMAATLTHLTVTLIAWPNWIELLVGGILFLFIYFIAIPLTRALNKSDIIYLREMLSELGPLASLFNVPLGIVERFLSF